MNSKLQKDLSSLVENEVISADVGQDIAAYYQAQNEAKPNRLYTIFGILGALLVGLGIILILAHNWDRFSKSLKTFLAFTPLIIGQLIVAYTLFKSKSSTWREASGTFLFFAVGASIALISQIYNIPGDLSGYLLTWTLLCLPLIYILRSYAVLLLSVVFSTYYACVFGYGFMSKSAMPWWFIVLFVSLLPFYIHILRTKKSSNAVSIFNWLLPLSLVITLGAFTESTSSFGFLMYVLLFGVLYNLGRLPLFYDQKLRRNGYLVIGSLGTVISLLITSFKWLWERNYNAYDTLSSQEVGISIILFSTALLLVYRTWSKARTVSLFQIVFFAFALVFISSYSIETIPIFIINALLFVLGINAIHIGVRTFHFGVLNYGLLIISALVVCRFFDTDMSFVFRGLLFVTVGVGFFTANYMMLQKQKNGAKSISK